MVKNEYSYRAELDGLRAVAILCVVLFHAYPQTFSGGLMGVDVFFVLSGYLITKLLQRSKLQGAAKVWQFYRQRLQRLYPPLLLFLLVILALAWARFDTLQYNALLPYVLSATTFSTNIHLALDEGGLFSDAFAVNPLLHLWSLSIEMQLYLLWPFLLTKKRLVIAALFSVLSVVLLSILGQETWQFYAPSSRLFELAIGAIIALYGLRVSAVVGRLWVVALGMGLWLITPYEPYPNALVVFPILVAVLVLSSPAQKILTLKPVVYVGRISYSWYLWHWGLLALYASQWPAWSLLVMSFVVAAASYRFVEQPLQRRRRQSLEI